jgi:hypothetical protein
MRQGVGYASQGTGQHHDVLVLCARFTQVEAALDITWVFKKDDCCNSEVEARLADAAEF